MSESRISSSTSYEAHWPSILSHNRSAQQRSDSSQADFGEAFREQLSASDQASRATKAVQVPPDRSGNEKSGSPSREASGATSNAQQATAQSAPSNANHAKTVGLPKNLSQAKTLLPQTKTTVGNNAASSTGKESRKISSRSETESGDPQADVAGLPLKGEQTTAALSAGDDISDADDEESAPGETQWSNEVDGIDGASSPGPVAGDLAMAMRISSESPDSTRMQGQSGDVEGTAAQNIAGLHSQAQMAATLEPQQRHEPDVPPAAGAIAITQSSASAQTEKSGQTEESASTHSSDFEAEFNKFRNEPVRGAHVQIAGAENQRVDIRLQERGGALAVTVRSNDSALAGALQDHAPELNARLSVEHFRTELWTPQQRSGGSGGQNQERSAAGEREQVGQGQGQKGKQNQEPEWVKEFENRPAAFQKRIDYTWHQ